MRNKEKALNFGFNQHFWWLGVAEFVNFGEEEGFKEGFCWLGCWSFRVWGCFRQKRFLILVSIIENLYCTTGCLKKNKNIAVKLFLTFF